MENKWELLESSNEDREKIWTKNRTFAGDVWFRFRHKPTAIAGLVLILVLLGYVLFRSTSMHRALEYFGAMFGLTGNAAADGAAATALKNHASALILCALASTPIACWVQKHTGRFGNSDAVKNAVCGVIFLAAVACIVSSSYNPFIYFAF